MVGDLRIFSCSALLLLGVSLQVTNGAVVTLQPNWPKIYSGEVITLACEIKNGEDAEWEYEWRTTSSIKPPNENSFTVTAHTLHNGYYRCRERNATDSKFSTKWSSSLKLTVYGSTPQPVLTVSPLWLSHGDSVTLKCEVEHPSAGWSFYWYKSVPKPQKMVYVRRQLNGSISGTAQDSYVIHGPTHTAAYRCKAGRGNPEYYTLHSGRKFVWSRDFNPAASLTLIPNRADFFLSEHVALSCQGNATEWRVMRFTEMEATTHCSGWGKMTGSTCSIHRLTYSDGVYWCESGTGEFSNAVNITVQATMPEGNAFPWSVFVWLLSGIIFIILLLFMYHYIKSKDSRRERAAQSTSRDNCVNRGETEEHIYASLEGDISIYESMRGCEEAGNGP